MNTLRVIAGTKKAKQQINYGEIYLRSILRVIEGVGDITTNRDALKKYIWNNIKYIGRLEGHAENLTSYEDLRVMFDAICSAKIFIGQLTPLEFMTLFPIEKKYDGKRYGVKDYFYTIEMLKGYPMDKLICEGGEKGERESVSRFLWDYQNWDVSLFVLYEMNILGKLHKLETGKDVLDDFFESQGKHLPKYTMYTDKKGKQFMMNEEGNVCKLKKKTPRYLRPVKEDMALKGGSVK